MKKENNESNKQNVYSNVTNKIITKLENGVKPWEIPWNLEHTEESLICPLRHNMAIGRIKPKRKLALAV